MIHLCGKEGRRAPERPTGYGVRIMLTSCIPWRYGFTWGSPDTPEQSSDKGNSEGGLARRPYSGGGIPPKSSMAATKAAACGAQWCTGLQPVVDKVASLAHVRPSAWMHLVRPGTPRVAVWDA